MKIKGACAAKALGPYQFSVIKKTRDLLNSIFKFVTHLCVFMNNPSDELWHHMGRIMDWFTLRMVSHHNENEY